MTKQEKINQYKSYITSTEKQLARANLLLSAVQSWSKKTINKTFFEHYFTTHNEQGEVSKDWKGNINTSFYFCDPEYNFNKYAKRVFIHDGEYITVNDTSTFELAEKTKQFIEAKEQGLERYNKVIKDLEAIDEQAIVKDLLAVYKKHNCDELWRDILDDYQVKYPRND